MTRTVPLISAAICRLALKVERTNRMQAVPTRAASGTISWIESRKVASMSAAVASKITDANSLDERQIQVVAEFARIRVFATDEDPNSGEFGYKLRYHGVGSRIVVFSPAFFFPASFLGGCLPLS